MNSYSFVSDSLPVVYRAFAATAALAAFLFFGGCEQEVPEVEIEETASVSVIQVAPETIYPTLEFTGTVVSQEIARIHPEVAGTVESVLVREGNRVKKGDPLAELDPEDFRLRLQIAQAETLKASSEYRRMIRGYRPQDIEATRNNYENALAIFRSKEKNLDRNRVLYESGTMTERDWTMFVEDLAAASAIVGRVSSELSKMEQGYESYDIQSASAAYMLALANERLAERALEHTSIRSPIDGVVAHRDVEIGQLVGVNQVILEIQNPDKVWLFAEASAKEAGLVSVGQSADLYSDTLQSSRKGHVERLAEVLDPNTKSLAIWFAWNDASELPPVGSFAKGTLHLDPIPETISLNRLWVHLEKGLHFVWAVENGLLVRHNVRIGKDRGEEVGIESGLREGTLVVVSPPASFEEGLPVDIAPAEPAPKKEGADKETLTLSMTGGDEKVP